MVPIRCPSAGSNRGQIVGESVNSLAIGTAGAYLTPTHMAEGPDIATSLTDIDVLDEERMHKRHGVSVDVSRGRMACKIDILSNTRETREGQWQLMAFVAKVLPLIPAASRLSGRNMDS